MPVLINSLPVPLPRSSGYCMLLHQSFPLSLSCLVGFCTDSQDHQQNDNNFPVANLHKMFNAIQKLLYTAGATLISSNLVLKRLCYLSCSVVYFSLNFVIFAFCSYNFNLYLLQETLHVLLSSYLYSVQS